MGCSRRCWAPHGLGAEGCQNWRGQHRAQAARDPARVVGLEGVCVVGVQGQLGHAQSLAGVQFAADLGVADGAEVGLLSDGPRELAHVLIGRLCSVQDFAM